MRSSPTILVRKSSRQRISTWTYVCRCKLSYFLYQTSLSKMSLLPVTTCGVPFSGASHGQGSSLLEDISCGTGLRALTSRVGVTAGPAEIILVSFYQNTVPFLLKQLLMFYVQVAYSTYVKITYLCNHSFWPNVAKMHFLQPVISLKC